MNVRKFIAPNARDALRKVKETLGNDAIILSNRGVPGGVEIMAVAARDMAMIVPTPANDRPAPAPRPAVQPADDDDDENENRGDGAMRLWRVQPHAVAGADARGAQRTRDGVTQFVELPVRERFAAPLDRGTVGMTLDAVAETVPEQEGHRLPLRSGARRRGGVR